MRRERPCCRAAENRNEIPPPHSRASPSMVRPEYQMISHMALTIAALQRVPKWVIKRHADHIDGTEVSPKADRIAAARKTSPLCQTHALQQKATLLDDLVGAGKQ